ncbi:MAG TPA: long-chain fatty acid--CoA ligase [Candidatus Polarisedimenticolia bacterium]|nr:long-chain fatty acid--CoA ligase [Candidatus Polarisedimenticolia bacterium]
MPLRTLCDILTRLEKDCRKPDLLRYKAMGEWKDISAADFVSTVRGLALGFHALGIEPGERVALLSENRPEWVAFDHALLNLGAVVVPLYPSLLTDQIRFILDHCRARALVLSGEGQLTKIIPALGTLPGLSRLVVMDPPPEMPTQALTFTAILREGQAIHENDPSRFEAIRNRVEPDDLASILYTSGTTADPKGVMLSHSNFASNVDGTLSAIPITSETIALSFLPLSHAFERVVHFACLTAAATLAYAESVEAVGQNLQEVHPHLVATVPRLLEKIHGKVEDNLRAASPVRRSVVRCALAVGRKNTESRLLGRKPPLWVRLLQGRAERLVHAPLRGKTFGRRIRFVISGAAPLGREVCEFFYAIGLPVLEGYGLTEASPVVSVNTLDQTRIGTVGRPLPGVEIRIAEDGEILVRGGNVMKGYYRDEAATREAIQEGWLHTGDVGQLSGGFLVITDRKKEILKTSGGKMVAPQPLENLLKSDPAVSQAVVIGDRRKFITALLAPDFDWLIAYARRERIPFSQPSDLVKEPRIVDHYRRLLETRMAGLPSYETVKKFRLLPRELSQGEGELTPTLKLKRRVIEAKYSDLIASMYNE